MAGKHLPNKIIIRKLIPKNIGPPKVPVSKDSTVQSALNLAQQRDTSFIQAPKSLPGQTHGQNWYYGMNMFGLMPINFFTGMFVIPLLTGNQASFMGIEKLFTWIIGFPYGFAWGPKTPWKVGMGMEVDFLFALPIPIH